MGPRLLSLVVVLWLAGLAATYGAFLVPLRWGGTPVPVALLLAVGAPFTCSVAGARVMGRRSGAVLPAVVWVGVTGLLATGRREGDLVIPGSWTGTAYVVLGALSAVFAASLPRGSRR